MTVETTTATDGEGPTPGRRFTPPRWVTERKQLVIAVAAVVLLPALGYLGLRVYDAASALATDLPDPCAAFTERSEALPPLVAAVPPVAGESSGPDRRLCTVPGPSFRITLEYRLYERDRLTSPGGAADAAVRAEGDRFLATQANRLEWKNALAVGGLGDSAVGYAAGNRADDNRLTFIAARRGNAVVLVLFTDFVDDAAKDGWLGQLVARSLNQIPLD
jgi:hypothetical protein